jgi:hypothetical protein
MGPYLIDGVSYERRFAEHNVKWIYDLSQQW